MRGFHRVITGVFALATFTACRDGTAPTGPAPDRQVGVLQLEPAGLENPAGDGSSTSGPITWDHPPVPGAITPLRVIELPDTVQVGQQVEVIVRTVLMDGCWRTDGQDVTQAGLTVEVTPHDVHSGAPICTMLWGAGEHRFTATFTNGGLGTVRLHGRLLRQANGTTTTEAITAERTVVVR